MSVDGYTKMLLQSTNLLIGVQVYAVTSCDLHYDDLTQWRHATSTMMTSCSDVMRLLYDDLTCKYMQWRHATSTMMTSRASICSDVMRPPLWWPHVQVYAVTSCELHYDDLTWPCTTKEGETSIIHQRLATLRSGFPLFEQKLHFPYYFDDTEFSPRTFFTLAKF